jgi:ABC-type proline/glycine betaine transport system permease subunit
MVDTRLILSGALPAALLALVADAMLTRVEHSFARRRGEA